jgi:3,4-dihydroxy 2-butanone 4-phosphate synthase/GTP cyclohydrolase II
MKSAVQLNTIEEAIEDIKKGKVVIVVDDENRENEGDFIAAAEKVTKEMINFMATYGRGLICAPLVESRCEELQLDLMVTKNSTRFETPFTVSVDLISSETTTGISANDRALTIKALTDPTTKAENLGRPGHIFPLKALEGGVLRRSGHTEAAIDLARLAGLSPAGVIVEIMNEDGTMARLPQLRKIATKFNLKLISIADLIEYRLKNETLIEYHVTVDMPTKHGHFKMAAYKQLTTGQEHLAIYKGKWKKDEPILVRVHSSCVTGDIFGSCRCDCGPQLAGALEMIEKEGKGLVVYMNQEGRGIGLLNKLSAYKLQEEGLDTVEANIELGFKGDERDYGIGAQIIRDLNISKIRLISNNPKKRTGLIGYGLEIVENVPLEIETNDYNYKYLKTKKEKMGHQLNLNSHEKAK